MVDCRSKIRIGALLLLTTASLSAQEYSFRAFGKADGLDNLTVRQLFEDDLGFIWVSTENGIYRYDGERFEVFGPSRGIPSSSGAAFGEAPDGSLLAGGDFGLYHLRGNHFEKVAGPFKTVDWAQGIQSDGRGHTFLGTDAGLMRLASKSGQQGFSIQSIPPPAGVAGSGAYGVLVDKDVLWYGCGLNLCRIDREGTRVLGRPSGLPEGFIIVLRKDGAGNLWVRVRNNGAFVLPAGESLFRRPDTPTPGAHLGGVPAVDGEGRILLPTVDGLLIRDPAGWRKIDAAAGLRGVVYDVFEDRQHSLWIGLAGRGIVQWRGYQEWESYSTANGLANDIVYEILPQPNGVLWVATEGGLLRGTRQALGIRWSKIDPLFGFPVHSIAKAPDGDLWIGTETRGAARFDPQTGSVEWFREAKGLAGNDAYTLRFDRRHRLWAATEFGLFVAEAPYRKFSRVSELPRSRVWAVTEATDGTLWAGGAGGLFALAGGRWKNWSRASGLSNQEVLSLGAGPDGAMWIGYRYGGGIDRVRLNAAGGLAIEKGVQRPGTNGLVYFLNFDTSGRLWAGTEQGVDTWDGARWSHYDSNDGMAWDDCDLNAFAAEPDGTIWIGTSGGLSRFRPLPHPAPRGPLEVVFSRLIMGQTDVSALPQPVSRIRANSLVARYSALNAARENGASFRYRLVGANAAWTETTQRELQFAQLAPGNYRLEIEAQDGNGVWSDRPAVFSFKVSTPWFASWWFIGICILLPFSAGAAVLRLRSRAARHRELELRKLKVAHDEIRSLAFYDPLTGLPNRRLLLNRLQQTLAANQRNPHVGALLFVDLDNFKTLNDTLGHQTGDLMLQEVARRISACTRGVDTVARLGGDEFVVMLENLSEICEEAAAKARSIGETILAAVRQPYVLSGHECQSTSSIGITVFGGQKETTDNVLKQADIAMYGAKAAGRNTLHFFAPALQAAVDARAELELGLRLAITEKQFVLHYQAQVEHGRLIGAETLVRWMHPERGLLPPGMFIPLAEETGLILPLGNWVLESACRQIALWADRAETAGVTLSVNISAMQLRQPDFVQQVLAILDRTGANPHQLDLELTESMLLDNIEDIIRKMTELKSHGLRFSLDDFGTGYSSLSYLNRLPLDQLKIDRSFVNDMLAEANGSAIAQAIISLGETMGLSVIAEGVETEQQRELLAHLGCHAYQGFLFSKPLPLDEFEQLFLGVCRG